jgi:hypothetical protein
MTKTLHIHHDKPEQNVGFEVLLRDFFIRQIPEPQD